MAAIEATPVETVAAAIAAETEKVMQILPNFKYSEALVQEETVEDIRCQLKALSNHSAEVKANVQNDIATAQKQLQDAEATMEQLKDSERQGVAQLESKVHLLVEAQMQVQDVEAEKKKADAEHQDYLSLGEEMREAKSKNIMINEGAFCSLLNGSWTSEEDMKEKLEMLKEYLQDIGTEKTLVLAADGLSTAPDTRGDFDKMAIDCITEELSSKLTKVEEILAERAPTEREVRAEVLGLQALLDVYEEKADAVEQEHKQVEVLVKGSKTEMKTCKQQVTKASKELEKLKNKMEEEETKAKALEEAFQAVERLVEAAKVAAAEKAAAEKAAAEKAAAEKAAAEKAAAEEAAAEKAAAEKAAAEAAQAAAEASAEAEVVAAETEKQAAQPTEVEASEDLEPPSKRMRTGQEELEPMKEAKLENQVASPARVRVSIG